jgi:hypothetical protein
MGSQGPSELRSFCRCRRQNAVLLRRSTRMETKLRHCACIRQKVRLDEAPGAFDGFLQRGLGDILFVRDLASDVVIARCCGGSQSQVVITNAHESYHPRPARKPMKSGSFRPKGNQARVIGVGTWRQTRLDRNAGLTPFSFEQPWKPAMHAAVASSAIEWRKIDESLNSLKWTGIEKGIGQGPQL